MFGYIKESEYLDKYTNLLHTGSAKTYLFSVTFKNGLVGQGVRISYYLKTFINEIRFKDGSVSKNRN